MTKKFAPPGLIVGVRLLRLLHCSGAYACYPKLAKHSLYEPGQTAASGPRLLKLAGFLSQRASDKVLVLIDGDCFNSLAIL